MGDQPAINFGGNVGKVNLNTGTGTQITGDGANVNTGDGTINVGGQTFGGASPVAKVFDSMVTAAKTEQPRFQASEEPSASPEVLAKFETPAAMLEAARDEAVADIAAVEPMPIGQFQEKQALWQERFAVIAPKVLRVALVTGKAALDSYVSQSPVIAALKAMVGAISE